jgi:hypothetical protein
MRHPWPSSLGTLTIEPDEEERRCTGCPRRRVICDHRFRRLERLSGPVRLCCKLLKCPDRLCPTAGKTFSPKAEYQIAPPHLASDWELFAWVGHKRYARHWSVPDICASLREEHHIVFSPDTIENYVRRYERMVAARHLDRSELVDAYANVPDLVLAIDGLQPEKGHETLYVVRELNAPRVWFAVPLLSSTAAEIEALFVRAHDLATALGKPVRAWVSDKQDAFVSGIAKTFPETPHRLCKIHFVRAVAKETRAEDGKLKVKMRKKVRGLRAIEREVLAAERTATMSTASTAGTVGAAMASAEDDVEAPCAAAAPSTTDETLCVREGAATAEHDAEATPVAADRVVATATLPAAVTAAPAPTSTWTTVVRDYCAATRGVLNDDQGTLNDPPGVRMARALEQVMGSLDACLDAKKGGPQITR